MLHLFHGLWMFWVFFHVLLCLSKLWVMCFMLFVSFCRVFQGFAGLFAFNGLQSTADFTIPNRLDDLGLS